MSNQPKVLGLGASEHVLATVQDIHYAPVLTPREMDHITQDQTEAPERFRTHVTWADVRMLQFEEVVERVAQRFPDFIVTGTITQDLTMIELLFVRRGVKGQHGKLLP